jgi:hypothetical protein
MAYQTCLVTFFDILGFGNLVKTQKARVIERILRKLKKEVTPDPGPEWP